jgi:hypothetical protein
MVEWVISIEEFGQVRRRFGQLHIEAPAQLCCDIGRDVARLAFRRIESYDLVGAIVLAG